MKVLLWFRKSTAINQITKTDPEGSIQVRITIDSDEIEIGSTKIGCKKSAWDATNQRMNSKKHNSALYNKKLSGITSDLFRLYDVLNTKYDHVSPATVKDYYLSKRKFTYTIEEIKEAFFVHREKLVAQGSITDSTRLAQLNYSRHILDFTNSRKITKPTQITSSFYLDLFEFMIDDGRSAKRFAGKVVSFSKQMFKWARKKGLCPILSALESDLPDKVDSEDLLDTTHLTISQLEKLFRFDFYKLTIQGNVSKQTADVLSRERDAFVFNCFTGMHHCDYTRKEFHIEAYKEFLFLKGKRQKTDKNFAIKLLEPAVEILKKYNNELINLPSKSNQKRNASLKTIAILAELPIRLTTKIARKTFCDLALNEMFMTPDDVAACLGLTNTKYLKNYGRIREKRLIHAMKSWSELQLAC